MTLNSFGVFGLQYTDIMYSFNLLANVFLHGEGVVALKAVLAAVGVGHPCLDAVGGAEHGLEGANLHAVLFT